MAKFDGGESSEKVQDIQQELSEKEKLGGSVDERVKEDKRMEEEEKKMESIGRVDPASGKTFMWPAISSGN